MTQEEHEREIRRTLRKLHRALNEHHDALACAARECGEGIGLSEPTMQAARTDKNDQPDNPPPPPPPGG